MKFTFTNKETYLAYRSNWKATYNKLSQEIRALKVSINETQREKGYAGSMQYQLLKLRKQATAMIEERKASKIEAQRQYVLANKEELVMA